MTPKTLLVVFIFITFVLLTGCTSVPVTTPETPTPTSVATIVETIIETPMFTVGPTPTPEEDLSRCYWHNTTDYPDYCYERFYWVRPTYSPPGSGYTAKVWRNSGCVDLNRTSGLCEGWGSGEWYALFLHNLTAVRNVTGVNNTEMVASVVYYNKTYDLNAINGDLTFSEFIDEYWDGTYPSFANRTEWENLKNESFEEDKNVSIPIVYETFNPEGF